MDAPGEREDPIVEVKGVMNPGYNPEELAKSANNP
jgi:hypothetical protein